MDNITEKNVFNILNKKIKEEPKYSFDLMDCGNVNRASLTKQIHFLPPASHCVIIMTTKYVIPKGLMIK